MKKSKKSARMINKEGLKKISTLVVLLFFAIVITSPKNKLNTELTFIRNDELTGIHSAAQNRDYLFQDEGSGNVQEQVITGTENKQNIDTIINSDPTTQMINNTGILYTGKLYTGAFYSGTQTQQQTETPIKDSFPDNTITVLDVMTSETGDCITPWKEKVKNKDFVLAYQQRKDVNTICNIEKRVCNDGVLGGSFSQNSCREDVIYVYRKAEVVTYNQKVLNEYIQPAEPINAGAAFDTQGKINTTTEAIDTRGTGKISDIIPSTGIKQTPLKTKANCTTPRGQWIKHGQFIKAYKAPRGFIDLPCEVEIRACVNGKLKGTLPYSKCTFNNTTYSDYLKTGAPISNTGFLFFQRIKSAFK